MTHAWIVLGGISGLIGVAMGAFGAHALEGRLEARALSIWQTAAQYQMYHSLALVAVGLWIAKYPSAPHSQAAAWAFAIGCLVFSGSLYTLALSGIKVLGAITPIGGAAFMLGWIFFALSAWRTET